MNTVVVTFGEIMTRLSAPGNHRLRQCLPGSLDAAFAGAESNIAAAIALLGGRSRFVTALPSNVLGDACAGFLAGFGVDMSAILRTGTGRMPQYFIETGVAQRGGTVLYDRDYSSFSLTPGDAYDWDAALAGASVLVISGISPALSANAAAATLHAAQAARARGITVCCDLNFRAKLWNWEPGTPARALARRVMGGLMPFVDVVLTNPDQAFDVLDIPWDRARASDSAAVDEAARAVARAHPHLRQIVFTLRDSHSASHNDLGALLYEPATDTITRAPSAHGRYTPLVTQPIVDRLGAGDAFAGGYLFALNTPELAAPATALSFGIAASCLAHSIPGDINFVSRSEVETLMRGDASGRVSR